MAKELLHHPKQSNNIILQHIPLRTTMFHLLILLKNISWILIQLLNVDHGFFKGDLIPWQQNCGCITAHNFVNNLNVANDVSEHAFNLLTTFNMGKVTQRKK